MFSYFTKLTALNKAAEAAISKILLTDSGSNSSSGITSGEVVEISSHSAYLMSEVSVSSSDVVRQILANGQVIATKN